MTELKRSFSANVLDGGKITIPIEIRQLRDIKTGDKVDIPDVKKSKPE